MAKRWFKIKHGLGVSPMVRSMGSAVWGGDCNAALGCWVRWLDYVETHSTKSGRVAVGSLAGFGELVIGIGSKKSVCERVAGWLVQYRDEQGEPILTFDEETGVVQMLRWPERLKDQELSTPRTRAHKERKKLAASSDPPDGTEGTVLSLSISSSGSSPDSEEPESAVGDLPDELFDGIPAERRPSAAAEVRRAWRAWMAAREHRYGEIAGASVMVLRRTIAQQMGDHGPEFVAWALNRAAAGAWSSPVWKVADWKAERTASPSGRKKGGVVF